MKPCEWAAGDSEAARGRLSGMRDREGGQGLRGVHHQQGRCLVGRVEGRSYSGINHLSRLVGSSFRRGKIAKNVILFLRGSLKDAFLPIINRLVSGAARDKSFWTTKLNF